MGVLRQTRGPGTHKACVDSQFSQCWVVLVPVIGYIYIYICACACATDYSITIATATAIVTVTVTGAVGGA